MLQLRFSAISSAFGDGRRRPSRPVGGPSEAAGSVNRRQNSVRVSTTRSRRTSTVLGRRRNNHGRRALKHGPSDRPRAAHSHLRAAITDAARATLAAPRRQRRLHQITDD